MRVLGIASLGHDASVTLVEDDQILFAGHAERYSRVKNDGDVNLDLIHDAIDRPPDAIVWYERPVLKRLRMLLAGQSLWMPTIRRHLADLGLAGIPVFTVGHHHAHAAGGYFTSPFDDAAVLVVDAIGEMDTISLWHGQGDQLKRVWSQRYPHSLGLLYSAFTQRCGLKPNEEEYILMGMAAFGQPSLVEAIRTEFLDGFRLKRNVHRGIGDWPEQADVFDLAASIQQVTEDYLLRLVQMARQMVPSRNLVLMGGVALNCVANSKIATCGAYDNLWIMPNPGDAGSSLGAIAAKYHRRLNWTTPYLGTDIARPFDHDGALQALLRGEVIGIANGRAEFGPRALGNRSLICDPRGATMKERVNQIKRREPFRPFAPVVKEACATAQFVMPMPSTPYMQFTAQVRRPDLYPAICHIDGTARVQTLTHEQNPSFYRLLDAFHRETGCPLLLNTSLNIKGQPLVNTWQDAEAFAALHRVALF